MTKRELIDEILTINRSASPSFLARFTNVQLDEYLAHLHVLAKPRLSGSAAQYEKYFRNCPTIRAPRPPWRESSQRTDEVVAADTEDDLPQGIEGDWEGVEEPILDYSEVDLQPAERHQLYVEPGDLPEGEEEEADEFGEELPSRAIVPQAALPADVDPAEEAQPEAEAFDEDDAFLDDDTEDEPAAAQAVVAAASDNAVPLFANTDEDTEAWLY